MFRRRSHPRTQEPCYQLTRHDPPERLVEARVMHGVHGRPFLCVWLFADRVELERGWNFMSGHAEWYDEETVSTWRPEAGAWPDGLWPVVTDWFSSEAVDAAQQVLDTPGAFDADPEPA